MKIGVCTGGGDCPGLNAAIRAITKHAIGTHNIEVMGIKDSFNGLMDRPIGAKSLNIDDVTDIRAKGGTILGTFSKGNPFDDPKRKDKVIKDMMEGYKQLGLDCVIVIGGDGTQTMSTELIKHGMNIIGIPKTIDNDLSGTEQTIGFSTAVDIVSEAVTRLQSTAESHDRIMVLEVMGRDSGYIALHGGMAGGAQIILIPEIPFSYDAIIKKVNDRKKAGRNYSVIVVAEGASEKGASMTYKENVTGAVNLGGIGSIIAKELHEKTDMDTRYTVLGHTQRGGSPNSADIIFATKLGVYAVELAVAKKFSRLIRKMNGRISDIEFSKIDARKRRSIAEDNQALFAAESIGINIGRKSNFTLR